MGYTAIVDYGVGNLKSIANAMAYLGLESRVTGDAGALERADAVILPGVGAFPDAAERLRETGLDRSILAQAEKKPVLGIFPSPSPLFAGVEEGCYVYFVHSFCAAAANPDHVIARTDYGAPVTAAVGKGNVYGCQFHPEKSGEVGLQILRNFGGLNR